MAVYDILPAKDLHFSDVRDTLNKFGGVVNNSMDSAFKSTAKINKWSKYKPIKSNKLFDLTYEDFKKGNFGLQFPASKYDPIEAANTQGYTLLLPNGGQNEPYRLGDFRNYFTKAKSICTQSLNYECDLSVHDTFTFTVGMRTMSDPYNISLLEVGLDNWYLAIVVNYTDTLGKTETFYKTSDKTLKDNGTSIIIKETEPPFNKATNRATYYWVAARLKKETFSGTDPVGQEFKALPFEIVEDASAEIEIIRALRFNVVIDKVGYSPTLSMEDIENYYPNAGTLDTNSTGALYIEVTLENKTGSSVGFETRNITGEVRPNISNQPDKMTTGYIKMDIYEKKATGWVKNTDSLLNFSPNEKKILRFGQRAWLAHSNGVQYPTEVNGSTDRAVIKLKLNDSYAGSTNPIKIKINEALPAFQ